MSRRYLNTTDVARAVGVHPNTVRLYEEWGYLPPIPRSPNKYRRFTQAHVDQMVLARTALQWPYPGGKAPVIRLVKSAAQGDLGTAMESAYKFLANVRAEQALADTAAAFLEQWAQTLDTNTNTNNINNNTPLLIGTAAKRLDVSADMLRNWERNGLLHVPRHPSNGYRLYGPAELGRARVIRVLRQAGYSVMAILRMMLEFDTGRDDDAAALRQALDTPRPDEDVYNVTDRWLTTLAETEKRAQDVIQLLAGMIAKAQQGKGSPT